MQADCRRCRHYYITWDPAHPHGCRAMGFKGRRLPVQAVRHATPGMDCQRFQRRPAAPRRPRRK